MFRMTAPINSPTIPDVIIPPMAPSRMTSMGTFTPRPNSMGLSTMSLELTTMDQIRKMSPSLMAISMAWDVADFSGVLGEFVWA